MRPRIYNSDAEKQAAYRKRKEAEKLKKPQEITIKPGDRYLLWSLLDDKKHRRLKKLLEHPSYK